jgi:hypothetical protein
VGTRLLDRRHLATAACLIIALPAAGEQLFNGRNLDGWYVWLRATKYEDPKKVFTVADGVLRISGEDFGGVATRKEYENYHLTVEWKWGEKTWGNRKDKARDSGILVHAVGEDGAYNGIWLESIESQIIEGGAGDYILVAGKNRPTMSAELRFDAKKQAYWHEGAPLVEHKGRFNWFGRSPVWKDVLGFRGANEVEKPAGEWNRQEIVCDGDSITTILNGIVVNRGVKASHRKGKIQLQSEGAEILIRKVELSPLR